MTRLDRISERLNLKEFQLKALLDVTKAINNNLGTAELLQLYESIMQEQLGITRLMLFKRVQGWERILAFGTTPSETELDAEHLFGQFTDISLIDIQGLSGFDLAVPVFHREQPLALLLVGDIDEESQRMSPTVKHLNFIQTLTNLIVVAMENKRMGKLALQQERDRRELELAAEMQGMLIPNELPNDDLLECAAWYQPHRQVGGDYYDVIRQDKDRVVLCVADVSGKGIAASLLMSNFQATLRALVQYAEGETLESMVHDLNHKVFSNARGERFITLFIAECDLRSRTIKYVNAGHNAPILTTGSSARELTEGGIGLGMMPALPFLKSGTAELPRGCTLLCYTDGLVEQEDAHEEPFGTAHLLAALRDFSSTGALAVNTAITGKFEAHRSGRPYLDDIALLTCKFK
ncbi:MAG: PP2C family protein-serine/threonine phosphatase [Flavobacteriales bacterium]|nr:PP2C family protein-serine/threonine phosphatase [Flavobacteriales bacterium]MBP6575340.1 PP2C family protein-serine/threonine phosphatase [Flavobacteriales bacterium]